MWAESGATGTAVWLASGTGTAFWLQLRAIEAVVWLESGAIEAVFWVGDAVNSSSSASHSLSKSMEASLSLPSASTMTQSSCCVSSLVGAGAGGGAVVGPGAADFSKHSTPQKLRPASQVRPRIVCNKGMLTREPRPWTRLPASHNMSHRYRTPNFHWHFLRCYSIKFERLLFFITIHAV